MSDRNFGEGLDPIEFTRFVFEELNPWYEWATQDVEGRPCRAVASSSLSQNNAGFPDDDPHDSFSMGGGYPYHLDGDDLACGKVDFNEMYGTHVGTIYYWKGNRYGITHYRYHR